MFDLLVKKVDLNQRCILGLTPLHHALQEGNLYFIRELLRNGANPHKEALVECVNPPIMGRTFIEQSFYKAPMTEEFITFMMNNFVKYWRSNDEIIKKAIMAKNEPLLLEMVKRLSLIGDDTRILMEIYCDTLEFPSVREYLVNTFDIEHKARDFVRRLSIFDACRNNNLLAVKIFVLTMNIDIEARNIFERTALHFASMSGHKEVVEFLLSKGSAIEAKNVKGGTALHFASYSGHKEVVEYLLSKDCDVKAKDNDEKTALHLASENGHTDVVKLLLSKGSAIDAIDKNE